MTHFAARPALLAVTAAATLTLAACGSSGSSSTTASGSAATGSSGAGYSRPTTSTAATTTAAATSASVVPVSADPSGALAFTKTTLHAKAGKVTVAMLNPAGSGVPHGIAIEGNGVDQDGPIVQPGGTSKDTLTLKPGTYQFYCPVPGHKAAGMKGTLIVR